MNELWAKVMNQKAEAIALVLALMSMLGSLYFSEYVQLVPCMLCWWQRIFMYPLVFILGVGIWRKDKRVYQYVLPISLIGMAIAAYHNYMYYQANYLYGTNETILTACSGGVSCTSVQLEWFGFVSIPLLSLLSFVMINGLMWWSRRDLLKKASS